MTLRNASAISILGEVSFVAEGDALAGVYLEGQASVPAGLGERVDLAGDPLLEEAATQFAAYLAGERRGFDLPLREPRGAFEASVREAMLAIPYGATTTYGQIAENLGEKNLAQAVGQAVGHNPFIVVVPCHRVLGAGGRLTGYAGGVDRKAYLLDLEQHTAGQTMLPPTAPERWEAQVRAEAGRGPDDLEDPLPLFTDADLTAAPAIDPDEAP